MISHIFTQDSIFNNKHNWSVNDHLISVLVYTIKTVKYCNDVLNRHTYAPTQEVRVPPRPKGRAQWPQCVNATG